MNEDAAPEFRRLAGILSYAMMIFRAPSDARVALRRLLEHLSAGGRSWIDSDQGWVRSGEWFLQRLKASEDWGWRSSDPEGTADA